MILVDTAIWIDHVRGGQPMLAALLEDDRVLTHPFIEGELTLGLQRDQPLIRAILRRLPEAVVATPVEVLTLIDGHKLHGAGIGYFDAHLLASARLTPDTALWTRDKRLRAVAERLLLAAKLDH